MTTSPFCTRGSSFFCDEKDRLLEEYAVFTGTAEQADSLRRRRWWAGSPADWARCLVRRSEVPPTLELERPTVEDIILFLVKGAKDSCRH